MIIYFSLTGNNERLAKEMKKSKEKVIEFCPGNGLRVFSFFWKRNLDKKAKQLKTSKDVKILGPIWGGRPCPPVKALLENMDFKGKVMVQLTHTGHPVKAKEFVRDLLEERGIKKPIVKLVKV